MKSQISALPDHSRIWIYHSNRAFSESEVNWISEQLENFTGQWKAHNVPLAAAWEIPYNQFLVLAVNEQVEPASGCSIDTSIHIIRNIENQLGVSLFDRLTVAFLINDKIHSAKRAQLKELWENQKIHDETLVLDNTVLTLGDYKSSWKKPLAQSWVARWLPVAK
jgi:hypothetical protein